MLFHSTIRKELARSFGATLVVLGTVVMTMMLIRALRLAAAGNFSPQDVMMVLGYTMLGHLPTLLTLSLFIASVSVLSRMYHESEMVIWFGAGRGLADVLKPTLRFAWPVLLGIGTLALLVWPWSNQQLQEMRARFEKRGDLERVAPGQFQESANGSRVFFIDKESADSKVASNVFIAASEHGKEAVTSARSGRLSTIDGDRFLLLSDGQRLESDKNEPGLKISEFAVYGTRIDDKAMAAAGTAPAAARSTRELLSDPTPINQGELAWRLGLLFAAVNLVLVSVGASSVNPRAGRSANLVFALLAFAVYYNLLNLGQSWIASGKVQFGPLMLMLHGGALAIGLGWLAIRHNGWNWRSALRGYGVKRRRDPDAEAAA